jgi:hypothetical protein
MFKIFKKLDFSQPNFYEFIGTIEFGKVKRSKVSLVDFFGFFSKSKNLEISQTLENVVFRNFQKVGFSST